MVSGLEPLRVNEQFTPAPLLNVDSSSYYNGSVFEVKPAGLLNKQICADRNAVGKGRL